MAQECSARPALSAWENLLLGVGRERAHRLLPGIGLAIAVMLVAERASSAIGKLALRLQGIDPTGRPSGISSITCAIVIGLVLGNALGVHSAFRPGLEFGVKKLLRLGIILVGIRLSFLDVMKLGLWGIPVVAIVIVSALLITGWFTRRIGLSDRLGALSAASTAICGVTAAVAIAPIVEADEQEVAYAVANVTLFGMLAMFVYPYLAHGLFGVRSAAAGLFLGTAIHDTSQVMGAAMAYRDVFNDELAMKVATVTKLTRNVFLAGVVPIIAYYFARKHGAARARVRISKLFPLFVLGFVAMAVIRSMGDAGLAGHSQLAFGLWPAASWSRLTRTVGETISSAALCSAMAAVGLTTNLRALRKLGLGPLYVGAASALIVGGVGLALAASVGPRMGLRALPKASAAPLTAQAAKPAATARLTVDLDALQPSEPAPVAAADTDRDGILDPDDACPNASGPKRELGAQNGCPAVRIEQGQIRLLDPIHFRPHSARLLPESKPTLLALAEFLRTHAELERVSLGVYTDNLGKRAHKLDLSRRRALALRRWLVKHHVPKARLATRGFGAADPIDSNDTAQGRHNNNRVEIAILDAKAPPKQHAPSTQ